MNKRKRKNNKSASIVLNTLKIKSPYISPNCGENHYAYISKKGKQKGIEFGEYYYEGGLFREDYYASWYYCHSCGYKWEIKNN